MKRPSYAHDDTLPRQIIVVPFSSDPLSANNGVFYYLTNHLGSNSVMSYHSSGTELGESQAT